MKKPGTRLCDHMPKHIFTLGNIDYYASDEDNIFEFDGDLVINLTKSKNKPIITSRFYDLSKFVNVKFEEFMIPWPDFGVPAVSNEFWVALHLFVKDANWKSVCVHCAHGHGRTGTALSALLISSAGLGAKDAVSAIRRHHCMNSVESQAQCEYLQDLDVFYNNAKKTKESAPYPSIFMKMNIHVNESGLTVK